MRTRSGWVLAVASVASLMVALDALVVTTALSTIRVHLGASVQQLEWTVNAYTLSFAVLLMTGAALGDRFGRRRLFVLGLGVFSLASAGCALAPSIGWLIGARAVQGVGAALVMPLSLTLVSEAYPPERRAPALGVFSGVTGLAVLGGPVVGGAITQGIAWQWIFWINVPIGLLTIPVAFAVQNRGGADPSNTDPYATKPTANNDWVKTGPHLMIVGSKEILAGHPSGPKPDTSVPYVMWAGTPYAHLMVPVGKS